MNDILTLQQAADHASVSRSFMYKLVQSGGIGYSKPTGKLIYIKREAVEAWMMSGYVPNADENLEKIAATYLATGLNKSKRNANNNSLRKSFTNVRKPA